MKKLQIISFVITSVLIGILIYMTIKQSYDHGEFGNYSIRQTIEHDKHKKVDRSDTPEVQTIVWHNFKIVYSRYRPIKDDSTAIKQRMNAAAWIKRVEANEK